MWNGVLATPEDDSAEEFAVRRRRREDELRREYEARRPQRDTLMHWVMMRDDDDDDDDVVPIQVPGERIVLRAEAHSTPAERRARRGAAGCHARHAGSAGCR